EGRGRLPRLSGPGGAEAERQPAVLLGSGEDVDGGAPVARDLQRDVGRGAEAEECEPLSGLETRDAQSPVPDDPGTQERRRLLVGVRGGQNVDEVLWRNDVLGIAAVGMIAGEARAVAEVLLAPAAEGTPAACPVKPGDPYTRPAGVPRGARPPSLDHADDLMTGDERQARERNLPRDHVHIGGTDAAGADADDD